jgi:hypothetical protein
MACRKVLRKISDASKRFKGLYRKTGIKQRPHLETPLNAIRWAKHLFYTKEIFPLILPEREDHPTSSFISKAVYVH